MTIPSPFEGLQIKEETVCEFFAVFSRFEFSLKELNICRSDHGIVTPAWKRFAEIISKKITINSELQQSIDHLINNPPLVQTEAHKWEQRQLYGENEFAQAIDATTRVRHNLFHGGKHTAHSPAGRDELLVKSALSVLYACINQDKELYETYTQNIF